MLGRCPAQASNQLISIEWFNLARSRWDVHIAKWGEKPPAVTSGIGGLDCAAGGDHANVLWARRGGYVEMAETWYGVDMNVTGDNATAITNRKIYPRSISTQAASVRVVPSC